MYDRVLVVVPLYTHHRHLSRFLYQIVPKFKAYAKENNVSGSFIIISTCSAKQSMCTYYMVSLVGVYCIDDEGIADVICWVSVILVHIFSHPCVYHSSSPSPYTKLSHYPNRINSTSVIHPQPNMQHNSRILVFSNVGVLNS